MAMYLVVVEKYYEVEADEPDEAVKKARKVFSDDIREEFGGGDDQVIDFGFAEVIEER